MRGKKRLILGVVLVIYGVATLAQTFSSLNRGVSLDEQIQAPGRLQASEAGRYYIWDNYHTVFNGKRVENPRALPDVTFSVRDAAGEPITFVPDDSQSWSIGNHRKQSIGYVDLPAAAYIRIDSQPANTGRVVSLSKTTVKDELWKRLGGFAYGPIAAVLGLLFALWGLIVRLRALDALPDDSSGEFYGVPEH